MLIGAQTTALALQTEDYTFSDHSLMKWFSNIIFCPGKLICWSSDGSYSVFRLCVSTYLVVVETHNITIDIPSPIFRRWTRVGIFFMKYSVFRRPTRNGLHLHYTTTRAQEKIHLAKKSGTFSTRVSTRLPANIQLR